MAIRPFALTDLTDKNNLIAWLNHDGNPPTVYMESAASRLRWSTNSGPRREEKSVADEATLDAWWSDHRAALAHAWSTSAMNQHKPQTRTQWIAECLKAIGIKAGGKVSERVQRAIIMRPDLYTDAATVKAREDAKEVERKALLAKMNLIGGNDKQAA